MSSSSLVASHGGVTHLASSSTRISVQAISPAIEEQGPSAGALTRAPTPSIKDHDLQHTTNSNFKKNIPIIRLHTPSVTEFEREPTERGRECAVEAVLPYGEHLKSPEDEKEAHQEKDDPFLVVWDKNDKENPRVCLIFKTAHVSF